MRVLITGATGFLGRYVVASAVRSGHSVTALVRPSRQISDNYFPAGVSIARGDVRDAACLPAALQDIDAVIHLAACVVGDDDSQFSSTVVGTENLLAAMIDQQVTRLVHCSTFSVYDWQHTDKTIDEFSRLEPDLYARDGYAISKTWQERLVKRTAAEHGWQLTILRPGFIWGAGNELIAGLGQSVGRLHFVIGVGRQLPLTYVENCADCFIKALDSPTAVGQTYNVIDSDSVTAWQYMGECLKAGATSGLRIPMPYWTGIGLAQLASSTSRLLFGPTGKLPGLFVPIKFRARFRPLEFPNRKILGQLGWQPKWNFRSSWQRVCSGVAEASLAGESKASSPASAREDSLV